MTKKKKYYVVWQGQTPGVYDNWADAQEQIKGYPGAKYKSYKDKNEAELAYAGGFHGEIGKGKIEKTKVVRDISTIPDLVTPSISVDAACSGNPGRMEYRGVETFSGKQLFHVGPMQGGTNNIGEFLGLIHALAYLQKKGDTTTSIYTDSRTALAWLRNKKVKTTLQKTAQNKAIFDLLERAIKWMINNPLKNPIIKWDTENWGEIPADFGRK